MYLWGIMWDYRTSCNTKSPRVWHWKGPKGLDLTCYINIHKPTHMHTQPTHGTLTFTLNPFLASAKADQVNGLAKGFLIDCFVWGNLRVMGGGGVPRETQAGRDGTDGENGSLKNYVGNWCLLHYWFLNVFKRLIWIEEITVASVTFPENKRLSSPRTCRDRNTPLQSVQISILQCR